MLYKQHCQFRSSLFYFELHTNLTVAFNCIFIIAIFIMITYINYSYSCKAAIQGIEAPMTES